MIVRRQARFGVRDGGPFGGLLASPTRRCREHQGGEREDARFDGAIGHTIGRECAASIAGCQALPGKLMRRWQSGHKRIHIRQLAARQELDAVGRHLVARRAYGASEGRERQRVRSKARAGGCALRLAPVALIAADLHERLSPACDVAAVRRKLNAAGTTLRTRHKRKGNHEGTKHTKTAR